MKEYCFGIDIGGTTVKCGLFNVKGDILEKWEIPTRTENNGVNILPDVAATIDAKIQEKGIARDTIAGVGVGIPGPVNELERYWYGEGEVKFYLDGDEEYPTICGTGTEDYFGGAWSFATQKDGKTVENTFCTPFLGYPYYSHHDTFLHNDFHNDDQLPQRSFYRWHIMDPILFEKDIRVTIQQIGVYYGGLFEREDDVASVAYWYQEEPHQPYGKLMDRKDRWPR